MSKHTAGPWRTDKALNDIIRHIQDSLGVETGDEALETIADLMQGYRDHEIAMSEQEGE